MVDLPLSDFTRNVADGVSDLYTGVANAAVDAMCGIYSKSPGSLVPGAFTGNPVIDGADMLYRNLCTPKGKAPPLPTPPFNGGQCCGTTYRVEVQATLLISNGQSLPYNATPQNIVGKILGVEVKNSTTGGREITSVVISTMQGGDCSIPTDVIPLSTFVNNSDGTTSRIRIDSIDVSPVSGSDNCGSPPAKYPTAPLSPSDFDFEAPITIAPNVTVNVPISIVPTIVPVVNVFRPEFNVKVGDVNVNLSLGGFTFSPSVQIPVGTITPSGDPRALPPTPKANDPSQTQPSTPFDLKPIKDKLDEIDQEIEECCDRLAPFDPPPNAKVGSDEVMIANSGNFVIPSKTFKVTLEITQRPTQEKVEFGNDAPNVVYAGWAWFGDGLSVGQRLPVDADFKVFSPPERVSKRFAFTMRRGYQALARVYYIV